MVILTINSLEMKSIEVVMCTGINIILENHHETELYSPLFDLFNV